MIIQKIQISNFRGFRDKEFDFGGNPVVLLAAANGVGKTTTIDAIEWCLTGEIGRLKAAFENRSTNDEERRMNTGGILKNRDAVEKAEVKVTLWLNDGKKEIVLCRVQKKDELDQKASTFTVDNDEKSAEVFFREYVGDSFYNYHFCDVQKSFSIQSSKRKKLTDLFGEFISDYDKYNQIADNLDIFSEDVARYIEDKEKEKASQELLNSYKEEIDKAVREKGIQVPYPQLVFYPTETMEIADLSIEELTLQKSEVYNCGYLKAEECLDKLVDNETIKKHQRVLIMIDSFWKTDEEAIQRAVKVGFSRNTEAITALKMKLDRINKLSLSRDTILQDGKDVFSLGKDSFTRDEFEKDENTIKEKENTMKELTAEVELLTGNNKVLKLFSSLSANKQVVIEYRESALKTNDNVRCPVCGSDSFATIDKELILNEADEYIRKNGEAVKIKEEEKSNLLKEIDSLYDKIINRAKDLVEKEREALVLEIDDLKKLFDKTQPYFENLEKLQQFGNVIDADELTAEKVKELLAVVNNSLLSESEEQEMKDYYQKILSVLGYRFENETVQQTYERVRNLTTKAYEVSNFTYEVFVTKLNAIESFLANRNITYYSNKLNEGNKKNESIEAEITALNKLRITASQRAADIREAVETLKKDEYNRVGPAISNFYNKLARFNSNGDINILLENDGISLIDEKHKSIANTLSNGQISVFMLAHFFAGINARNEHEKTKIYFIDDLTSCMDDVNMLAFMDLLKYQLSSKETIDQLFFITCDDRISNLLKYKLSGRGIKMLELSEADFI